MRLSFFLVIFSLSLFAQTEKNYQLSDPLPADTEVKIGKLKNGLTYYIRENEKPKNRAYIRLVVNTGSVMEDDDQKGLAHFVEHMAFNGTKNFEKHDIIDFMETIGMRFGPEVNAYTGFDETVYMLELPLDSSEVFEKGFSILRDWATNISFVDEEIDKERGVIIEEWRLGLGADARMRDKHFPVIFKNSKYAERLPIGEKEILENFQYDVLRRYYKDWYRPDLMAVVAVGDFDTQYVENLILKLFSDIEPAANARERVVVEVPDYNETRFSIASDKEATYNIVRTYFLTDPEKTELVNDYRDELISRLFNMMLNERFRELTKSPTPPFLNAFAGEYNLVRSKGTYSLSAIVKEGEIEKGLSAVLTEGERLKRYGFTPSELEREKKNFARLMQKQFDERDKMESNRFTSTYTSAYLNGKAIYGIDTAYELFNQFIGGITINEVNELVKKNITESNRIITVSAPQNDITVLPDESKLAAVFTETMKKKINAYEETISDEPLISEIPQPKSIIAEKIIEELGITEWTLANGVKVVLKPTDFKNDEILLTASSPGGNSLLSEDMYYSAIAATAIVNESGLGSFSNTELRRKLAGKIINVYPWIGELREGFEGTSSPEDIETLFQLVYMFFNSPRFDETAYQSFEARIKGYLENRSASPDAAFQDTLSVTMANYHFTSEPWSEKLIDRIDLGKAKKIYFDRFADASDFTFYFVGNLDVEKMRKLTEIYFANLPDINRTETWADINLRYPKGHIEKTVKKGIEPKSKIMMKFTGDFNWDPKTVYYMESVADYLDIKLREVIREDKSGTYGVGVWCSPSRWPHEDYDYSITFGCDPERVEELTSEILAQVDTLTSFLPEQSYVDKLKEQHLRKRETDLEENRFWLSVIHDAYVNNKDLKSLLHYDELVNTLTPELIHETAKKYFNKENYVRVILLPETK